MNKKFLPIFFIAGAILFFENCSTPLLVPNEADSQVASARWSDMNLEKMQTAHKLYINKCGNCHFLYRPNRFSEEHWLKKLPDMKVEAKLTDAELDLISKYILAMRNSASIQKSSH